MTIQPFADTGDNYTAMTNYMLDVIMPALPANAWKVLCFIYRKTRGWNKESDRLSYTQIAAGTGIKSSATISEALKLLETKHYIIKTTGDQWDTVTYQLNSALKIEANTATESPALKNEATSEIKAKPALKNEAVSLQKLNTQEEKKKNKDTKRERVQPHTPRPPTPVPKKQTTLSFAHEAVTSYQRLTGVKRAPPANADKIADTVIDLAHWEHVIKAWTGIGFRRDNVDGMLDWYLHPEKIRSEARNGRSIRQGAGKHFERATWTEDG